MEQGESWSRGRIAFRWESYGGRESYEVSGNMEQRESHEAEMGSHEAVLESNDEVFLVIGALRFIRRKNFARNYSPTFLYDFLCDVFFLAYISRHINR